MRALVVLAVLALSGCATVSLPDPGMSDAEMERYHRLQSDSSWQNTSLADSLRPPAAAKQVVTGEEWAEIVAECMNSAGFDNYRAIDGGLSIEYVSRSADDATAEIIAHFSCNENLWLEGEEEYLLNSAQLDYLYDYYQDVLVPCLSVNKVEIWDQPTREWFIGANGGWNPYYSVESVSWPLLEDQTIFAECPAMPPGMPEIGSSMEDFGLGR